MDALSKLSANDESVVVLNSLDQYVQPLASNAGAGGTGDAETIRKLRAELLETKKDLVKAVQGWRADRDTSAKNMEAHIVSNSARAIKAEMLTERKRLRGEIAKLKAANDELAAAAARAAAEHKDALSSLKAKVLAAETTKNYHSKNMRRESMKIREIKETVSGHQDTVASMSAELEQKNVECDDLRHAVERLMDELNHSLTVQREMQNDFDVLSERNEGMAGEIERLNKIVEGRRPGRKAPPPPKPKDFDFGAFSDSKVSDVINK
jgi:chromosome segregation ATPase